MCGTCISRYDFKPDTENPEKQYTKNEVHFSRPSKLLPGGCLVSSMLSVTQMALALFANLHNHLMASSESPREVKMVGCIVLASCSLLTSYFIAVTEAIIRFALIEFCILADIIQSLVAREIKFTFTYVCFSTAAASLCGVIDGPLRAFQIVTAKKNIDFHNSLAQKMQLI